MAKFLQKIMIFIMLMSLFIGNINSYFGPLTPYNNKSVKFIGFNKTIQTDADDLESVNPIQVFVNNFQVFNFTKLICKEILAKNIFPTDKFSLFDCFIPLLEQPPK